MTRGEAFWRTRTGLLILNAANKKKKREKRHTVHPHNKCSLKLGLRTACELPWLITKSQTTKKIRVAKKEKKLVAGQTLTISKSSIQNLILICIFTP